MNRRTFAALAAALVVPFRRSPAPAPAAPLWCVLMADGLLYRIEHHGPDDPPCQEPGAMYAAEGGGRGCFWIVPLGPAPLPAVG